MEVVQSLDIWLDEELRSLKCSEATKSYIISVLLQYRNKVDSFESFTLAFADARATNSFDKYQRLGDWIFWLQTITPDSIESSQNEYVATLAQVSYASCYRLLNGKWPLYEEMATRYIFLVEGVKTSLKVLK